MRKIARSRTIKRAAVLAGTLAMAGFWGAPLGAHGVADGDGQPPRHAYEVAWSAAGLDEAAAITHALDRLAFGGRPGDAEAIAELGLVVWLERQLLASEDEADLQERLQRFDAVHLSAAELAETFPNPGAILRQAVREGKVSEEDVGQLLSAEPEAAGMRPDGAAGGPTGASDARDARDQRAAMTSMAAEMGYRPQRELVAQTFAQKVERAVESPNQLREVLVDFWFNHFNVSIRDPESRRFVLAYERDAIRPHVLGSFRDLLEATARHPAMLGYLDNFQSRAEEGVRTALQRGDRGARGNVGFGAAGAGRGARSMGGAARAGAREAGPGAGRRPTGLNENYARELLELHTLGVDGGYTQDDVRAVARAFTGWTMMPPRSLQGGRAGMMNSPMAQRAGFVTDGLFVFHPGFHDAERKTVLGHRLPAGRGLQDGQDVLDLLAQHPSTARHLAHKLAVRFVADEPPEALVAALGESFTASRGDLRQVMRQLLASPEFWAGAGEKTRTPFELVVAALRSLDAHLVRPSRQLFEALEEMGQPLYGYDAPTGFPDHAAYWLSSSSLLARMKFGAALAMGEIPGLSVNLPLALRRAQQQVAAGRHEEALEAVVRVLLPGRDWSSTFEQLSPLVAESLAAGEERSKVLRQMIGWTIGSPEFQRR